VRTVLTRGCGRYGHVLAVDLVGHGRSEVVPAPSAYAAAELVADLADVLARFATPRLVLVGHSYGAALVAQLVPHVPSAAATVVAVVLVGAAGAAPPAATAGAQLARLPVWAVNLLRSAHRIGGTNSVSVRQMVRVRQVCAVLTHAAGAHAG
jgi:pimeloyl-ACP methyl ester carboxylesterase